MGMPVGLDVGVVAIDCLGTIVEVTVQPTPAASELTSPLSRSATILEGVNVGAGATFAPLG